MDGIMNSTKGVISSVPERVSIYKYMITRFSTDADATSCCTIFKFHLHD